jgi:hypothetical protein
VHDEIVKHDSLGCVDGLRMPCCTMISLVHECFIFSKFDEVCKSQTQNAINCAYNTLRSINLDGT